MAYRFKAGEPVPNEVRRIAGEELSSAAKILSEHPPEERDEAVHESRKSLKKVRAVLRLVRGELGRVYSEENARMRDTGRCLSEFRDAGAMIETFDQLREKCRADLGRQTIAAARRKLVSLRDEQLAESRMEPVIHKLGKELQRGEKRLRTLPLTVDGFDGIAAGLKRSYRDGRGAMATARKHPLDPNYHEWRKRAKDLWYHVRLLEDMWTDVLKAYEASLKELQDALGDDHNLVVLRDRVLATPSEYGTERQTGVLLEVIARYQKELRDKALGLGERIYEEKPRDFCARMRGLWDAWESSEAHRKECDKAEDQKS